MAWGVSAAVCYGADYVVQSCIASPVKVLTSVASRVAYPIIRKSYGVCGSKWRRRDDIGMPEMKLVPKFMRRRKREPEPVGGEHNIVAVDAAMKYQTLAEKRFEAARASLVAAEKEFRDAENAREDAKKYVRSVKKYCSMHRNKESSDRFYNDVVFVEHGEGVVNKEEHTIDALNNDSEEEKDGSKDIK